MQRLADAVFQSVLKGEQDEPLAKQCFDAAAADATVEQLCSRLATLVQKHRAAGTRLREAQAYSLFWYLDIVLSALGNRPPSDKRGRAHSSEFMSSPAMPTGVPSLLKKLMEPWHSLAVAHLARTRLLKLQALTTSFLARAMAADDDFAAAVLVQHFHEHTVGSDVRPGDRMRGADGSPVIGPSSPSAPDVVIPSPPVQSFVALLREYITIQPVKFVQLMSKHVTHSRLTVQHSALILLFSLLSTAPDKSVARLATGLGSSVSLFHVLLSALKQLAAPETLNPLGCANVLLTVWSLTITLPYSVRPLGASVHSVVALCGALTLASVTGTSPAVDTPVEVDGDSPMSLPTGIPTPSAWDSVGPSTVKDAVSFLLQCVYALFPATTLAACRAVIRETPATAPLLTSSLCPLQLHPSLLCDASEELDQSVNIWSIMFDTVHSGDDSTPTSASPNPASPFEPNESITSSYAHWFGVVRRSVFSGGLDARGSSESDGPVELGEGFATTAQSSNVGMDLSDTAAPPSQDKPMQRSVSAGDVRSLRQDVSFPVIPPPPPATAGKHAVSCPCLASIIAKQETNLQIHLRKQVARVWRHFQVEYSKLQQSALRQKAVEEALGRTKYETGVLRSKVEKLERACSASNRERIHESNVSQEKLAKCASDREELGHELLQLDARAHGLQASLQEMAKQLAIALSERDVWKGKAMSAEGKARLTDDLQSRVTSLQREITCWQQHYLSNRWTAGSRPGYSTVIAAGSPPAFAGQFRHGQSSPVFTSSGYEESTLAAIRKETEAAHQQVEVMRKALNDQRGFYEKQMAELRSQAASNRERVCVLERRLAAGNSPPPLM